MNGRDERSREGADGAVLREDAEINCQGTKREGGTGWKEWREGRETDWTDEGKKREQCAW